MYPLHNIPKSLLGEGWYFRLRIRVSAYPLHNIPRSLLGEGWYFRLPRIRVSAYPRIHFTIYLEVYLGRSGIFDCVSAYPLHNIPRSLLGEEWYFPLCIRVSTYPLYNIPRSLLGEEWYFRLHIRVSAYPLHNILLRSLLGEGCYFRLRIRVSSLFRGAASKWRGILQLFRLVSYHSDFFISFNSKLIQWSWTKVSVQNFIKSAKGSTRSKLHEKVKQIRMTNQ